MTRACDTFDIEDSNRFDNEQSRKRRLREHKETHIEIKRSEHDRLLKIEQEYKESKMSKDELFYLAVSKLKRGCLVTSRQTRVATECTDCGLECHGCDHPSCYNCADKECRHRYTDKSKT